MEDAIPGASSPTCSRAEDRRRLILETTPGLVAAGGVDSVTHRRVANSAGVPLGSTAYYFDSREHLLREASSQYLEQARSAHSELAAGFQDCGAEGVVEFLVELTHREFADENMMRGYELARLTRHELDSDGLRRRLETELAAFLSVVHPNSSLTNGGAP